MSGKIEYLEKYSVAPSPSRDYYGLKVLNDEVILYLWRISHGPHKTPIVRTSNFVDFEQDKSLQEEIRRGFGEYLLDHIRNIVRGKRNTLLTLPKCLIQRLIRYLTVNDIVKLSSLSHVANQIFDDNTIWESLYKRYRTVKRNEHEKLYLTTYNWKEFFKQEQMQSLINEQKNSRTRSGKQTRTQSKNEELNRTTSSTSKPISKITSSVDAAAKVPLDLIRKKTGQNPVFKKSSDIRLTGLSIENERCNSEKKTAIIKSIQSIGQKNMKILRKQSTPSKTELKRETENKASTSKSIESKPKRQNKVQRTNVEPKISNTSIRTSENKASLVKSKTSITPKVTKSVKPEPRPVQSVQNKSKLKIKTRKISQSKSTILSTDKSLIRDLSLIRDNSFDLADLLEKSLKNIRSPRSIFDYDFSCLEGPRSCAGDARAHDELRKSIDNSRATKINRPRATLDRLSEKSEPLTAKSIDSINKTDVSDIVSPKASFVSKNVKARNDKAKKSPDMNKTQWSPTITEDKTGHFERYGIYNKFPTPKMSTENKNSTSQKSLDKMDVLRSLGSNNLVSRKNTRTLEPAGNRFELKRTIEHFYKDRFKEYN